MSKISSGVEEPVAFALDTQTNLYYRSNVQNSPDHYKDLRCNDSPAEVVGTEPSTDRILRYTVAVCRIAQTRDDHRRYQMRPCRPLPRRRHAPYERPREAWGRHTALTHCGARAGSFGSRPVCTSSRGQCPISTRLLSRRPTPTQRVICLVWHCTSTG